MPNYGYDSRVPQRYPMGAQGPMESDSGVGSSSDQEPFSFHPNRTMPADYDDFLTNDPAQLHSMIRTLKYTIEQQDAQLKAKDRDLMRKDVDFRQLASQIQGFTDRNAVLEDDKARLVQEKADLKVHADRKEHYKEKYLEAKAQLDNLKGDKKSKRYSNNPPSPRGPTMSGGNPGAEDHLAERFNRKPSTRPHPPASGVTSSNGGSYYEAWGPKPRGRSNSISATPRRFSAVNVAQHENPAYSAVPRAGRPVSGYGPTPGYTESGNYHPYPL